MKYKVKNMSCQHCVMRIKNELKAQNITATVDLETKTVVSDDERVVAALAKIGYPVER